MRGEGNFYVPSMQVECEEDGYVVTARIPGAERDELHVILEGDVLRVTGERSRHRSRSNGRTREDSRYISRFTREIGLTREVEPERVEARFENGVLTVRLPFVQSRRVEEDKPTYIEIH
ncbi:MAG: Hsp20/alpha crystallin family protein [Planctomycetota bacterium]|nr:Hsp20/alpha crystallin family protein [Planctomycetota bacterium]